MYGWILCALKSIHATSPSLAGQTVVKTGSSPDSASSLVRSSQFLSDFHQTCSALQWRDRVGFTPFLPFTPSRAPNNIKLPYYYSIESTKNQWRFLLSFYLSQSKCNRHIRITTYFLSNTIFCTAKTPVIACFNCSII